MTHTPFGPYQPDPNDDTASRKPFEVSGYQPPPNGDDLYQQYPPPGRHTSPPSPGAGYRTPLLIISVLGIFVLLAAACAFIGMVDGTGANEAGRTPAAVVAATTPAPTTPTTPAATTPAATTPAATTPAAKPARVTYAALTDRQWKLIVKNPDAYTGKTYIVFGVVDQFDGNTGPDTFRASVAHKNMTDEYDYETNTLLTGSEATLANLVPGNEFRANVKVIGSFKYDTMLGGETSVPLLQISAVKVL